MMSDRKKFVKWTGICLLLCITFCMTYAKQVRAEESVSIVLTYNDTTYSTQVYGPEIENIANGMAVATDNWITAICDHVNFISFNEATINKTALKQDIYAGINAGKKQVSFDMAHYNKGMESKIPTTVAESQVAIALPLSAEALFLADLSAKGFNTKISECSTKYVVGQDRSQNITVAASRINGMIMQPGDMMSFDAVILPRTIENGYGMGNAIMGDDFIKVVGGGICQVSSTLNNAVLRAGIIPIERHNHSQNVSYLASGLDATISAGKLDYKFVNTLQYPIYISATTVNGVLTVAFYSDSKALNGLTYMTSVQGVKKSNTTYINGYLNGALVGSYAAYSSRYK